MKRFNKLKNFQLILSVFLFLTVGIASASALNGAREIRIIIERLDEDAAKCGISESLIDAAIRLPLSNSRINITERPGQGFIYANLNIIDLAPIGLGSQCAVNLHLEFRRYSLQFDQTGGFWRRGVTFVWNKNTLNRQVSSSIELYTKEFIAEWLKAN